ncbi:hypothetical protein P376_4032 [Streptomyces sp. HCCB10043]|nr:hypothetical protein P376_4032 [Streptomyces sp. HCCB10043]
MQQGGGRRAAGQGVGAGQVRGGVQQAEDGVHGDTGPVLGQRRVEGADDADPDLDVLALEAAHPLAVRVAQPVQLPVVEGDEGAVVEGEVDVALDERVQEGLRGAVAPGLVLRHPQTAAFEEPLTDPHQQFGEHRVLAGEVAVEAGAADADGGAYLVDADTVEAALGEEAGGLPEDLLAAGGGRDAGGGMGAHEDSF